MYHKTASFGTAITGCAFAVVIYALIAWLLSSCQSFAWKFVFALDVPTWKCFFIGLIPAIGQVLNGVGLLVWLLFA